MVKASSSIVNTQLEVDAVRSDADETLHGGAKNKLTNYNIISSIILGNATGGLVVQKFRIHEDLAINVFKEARMPTSGMITTAVGAVGGVIIQTRPNTITGTQVQAIAKGSVGRSFKGKLIKIPLPSSITGSLRKYFKKFGRKNAYVMFPRLATNASIALWIATHSDPNLRDSLGVFYTPSGTKVSFTPADFDKNDPGTIAGLLGSFSNTYSGKLANQAAN
jgi:hypothetical protein